jgi:biotin carboxyl carrier protein
MDIRTTVAASGSCSGRNCRRRSRVFAVVVPDVGPKLSFIVKVPVKVGEVVAVLAVMKMQNDLVATQPGEVTEIYM